MARGRPGRHRRSRPVERAGPTQLLWIVLIGAAVAASVLLIARAAMAATATSRPSAPGGSVVAAPAAGRPWHAVGPAG